jgi:hypothetical protein
MPGRGFHHIHLALKRHAFAFTHGSLTIYMRQQRTPTAQQYIQRLHQTMPGDAFLMTGRVMRAQTAPLFALRLVLGRVVPNQIAYGDGFPRTPLPFWAVLVLAFLFLLDRFAQLFMKAFGSGSGHFCYRPRRPAHKLRQTTQTLPVGHLAQQPAQRMRFLTQHQCQQYAYQILKLGLAEALPKRLAKLAQSRVQTDNRDCHRVSL